VNRNPHSASRRGKGVLSTRAFVFAGLAMACINLFTLQMVSILGIILNLAPGRRGVFASALLLGAGIENVMGHWGYQETKNVPISRLMTNLQARLIKDTNDFEITYDLARLHSMAYATNVEEVPMLVANQRPQLDFIFWNGVPDVVMNRTNLPARKIAFEHLTNAILLYERAIYLLKKSTNSGVAWLVLPTELGLGWCLEQGGRKQQAIEQYRRTFKIAWKFEVTGDFDFKEWVREAWGDAKAGRNPIRSHNRGSLGPGVSYSEETIRYLLNLLDPVKDQKEIAQLKADQKTLASLSRAITPLLVALKPDASLDELTDTNSSVSFDLDGSGRPQKWGWITPKAGWLVFDSGSGRIDSGLQMFGNVTFWIFWRDGYDALSSLDEDGDGFLRGGELNGIAVWHDANGNGVADPGEVLPVQAWGITAIECRGQRHPTEIQWNPCGVTLTNGVSLPTYDWIGRLGLPESAAP
jgi:hypothetical protein